MVGIITQAKRKKLVRLNITAARVVANALAGIEATWSVKAPGNCYRWVREVCWHASIPEAVMPKIATARLAFVYYDAKGWALPEGSMPLPGDLLFKVGPHDGRAGHVGIFVGSGSVAENSTAHIDSEEDSDARGKRPAAAFVGARIVRPPYHNGD